MRQMANDLQAVVKGGQARLGRQLGSDSDLREAIREGFPHAVLQEVMRASGLTLQRLASALDLLPAAYSAAATGATGPL
jgi:hypothetical protein